MRSFIRFLKISIALIIALLTASYFTGAKIPSLISPVGVEELAMFSDGGSIRIVIKDKSDQQFLFGLKGSLTVPQSEFPVYVQRWHPRVPYPIMLPQRSEEERALLNALNQWEKDLPPGSYELAALSHIRSILAQRNEQPIGRVN